LITRTEFLYRQSSEKKWVKVWLLHQGLIIVFLFLPKLSEFSMLSADNRSFNRFMFGGATEVDVDTIGRFLIPDFLKSRADLKEKVAIVGVQNRVEIWNENSWSAYKNMALKQADALAEKLGNAGML